MNDAAIGDLVVRVQTGSPSALYCDRFPYIDIDAIDRETGEVRATKSISVDEAPSRARQHVRDGDVLVSTVRPNLRQSAQIPPAVPEAIASTGFCVLRPGPALDGRYLYHFVRSDRFVNEIVKLCRGAQYPAVTDKDIKAQRIPAPPLDEQRRIAAVLDRSARLVKLHREAAAKTRDLIPALFIEMFGDPATNPMGWKVGPLSLLVSGAEGGKNVMAGAEGVSSFRILKVSAVTSGEYDESHSKPAPAEFDPPPHFLVQTGDLLFSRANTHELVGATALVGHTNGRTLLPDKLWRLVVKPGVSKPFLWALLQNREIRRRLSDLSSGTSGSMRNISQAKLFDLQVPVPPKDLQQSFHSRANSANRTSLTATASLQRAQELYSGILHEVFGGM